LVSVATCEVEMGPKGRQFRGNSASDHSSMSLVSNQLIAFSLGVEGLSGFGCSWRYKPVHYWCLSPR